MEKIKLYLLALLLLTSISANAQRPGQKVDPERLQAARIAFITSRIELTSEQAEKFWPIFNKYTETREATMRQLGDLNRGTSEISEEEAKKRIQKRFELQEKLLVDEKTFVAEVSAVLNQKQILRLNSIARDFTRHIYQRQRGSGN
ncbi:MAG: hypothetical protein B7Z16_15240 [Algoriphagus sp. 32-45-6]|jgi:hypothetical protein|nr:MAG: hypothetical protein B7Z16_15240 [Algoriphagus sp. 32-45-6]